MTADGRDGGGWRPGPRVAGAGGVEVATWDLGGQGPPIVLMHATGFHAKVWLPVAAALRRSHHVWALDQRGHGRSGHAPDRDYRDWSRFATDLLAALDELGLTGDPRGLTAAGHSLGGSVLLMAEQRRPGTFRSMFCYEPIVLTPDACARGRAEGVDLSEVTRKRRARFASLDEARGNFASKPPFDRFAPEALDAYVSHGLVEDDGGGFRLACAPEEEASVYQGSVLQPIFEGLPQVEPPVTMACGVTDRPPAAGLEEVAAELPDGRYERYDDLHHLGPMEQPARVGAAIAAAVAAAAVRGR